jgi:hypothetical protein
MRPIQGKLQNLTVSLVVFGPNEKINCQKTGNSNFSKIKFTNLDIHMNNLIITNAPSRASGTKFDIEILKAIAILCGVGLALPLILASYGFDLSPGFF